VSGDREYVSRPRLLEQLVRETISWQALEDQIRDQEDLDAELRAAAIDAIPALAKHLRRHFPAEAVLARHPGTGLVREPRLSRTW